MKNRPKRKEAQKSLKNVRIILVGTIVLLALLFMNICSRSSTDNAIIEIADVNNNEAPLYDDSLEKSSYAKDLAKQPVIDNQVEISSNRGLFIRVIRWFFKNIFRFLLIIALFYLFYHTILLRKENDRIKSDMRQILKNVNNTSNNEHLAGNFLKKTEFDQHIASIERRFANIESRNKQSSYLEANKLDVEDKREQQKEQSKVEFFPAPNKEGHFMVNLGSKRFSSGEHIYQFVYSDLNQTEAQFSVVNDTNSMKYAINYSVAILRNACEIENLMHLNPSKISNIKPGLVKRQGDKWVIHKKLLIRYD